MFTFNIDDIRNKINFHFNEKTPFLFGINFEQTEGFFIENPLQQTDVWFDVCGVSNIKNPPVEDNIAALVPEPLSYEMYKAKFDCVNQGLKRGDSFLANLTVKTPIELSLTMEEVFLRSSASYKLLLPGRFVTFSPERFIRIEEGRISTNPMKGTIDASLPDAAEVILNDFKETAEHSTIVDLLRNDLSIVADNVRVNKFRYIDHIRTNKSDILQVSSEIVGNLHKKYLEKLGDAICSMLPAGSISGAPKAATVDIIRKSEGEDRGYYTGVFGYFDGKVFDSAVIIRFIEKEGNNYYFRSGGGITAYSDCASEYEEVITKIYLPISKYNK